MARKSYRLTPRYRYASPNYLIAFLSGDYTVLVILRGYISPVFFLDINSITAYELDFLVEDSTFLVVFLVDAAFLVSVAFCLALLAVLLVKFLVSFLAAVFVLDDFLSAALEIDDLALVRQWALTEAPSARL
ncbi:MULTISPECIES: hypothetical protein [Neptunomonas]|uniref:hypothetical protein n=1 Tax=Neptunomonas TaxID=75687 RepID=UPI0015C1289D|nr:MULTISPECIES: hypothetical protein [Neptunomonas]MDN2658398.1 hypothetical protein [Neptunomonas sp. CHC150]QLE98643.1 hypothetical protein FLM49_13920 [Neptunomonas phycophila]